MEKTLKNAGIATLKGAGNVSEGIIKQVQRAAKLVGWLASLTLILSCAPLVVGFICACILTFVGDWSYWAWIMFGLLCLMPGIVGLVFWYAFSTVAGAPGSAEEISIRLKERFPKYAQGFKLKKYGGGKKMRLGLQLCWDAFMVTGNIDDIVFAGMVVTYAATPFGWITLLIAAGWAALGSLIMMLSAGLVLLF